MFLSKNLEIKNNTSAQSGKYSTSLANRMSADAVSRDIFSTFLPLNLFTGDGREEVGLMFLLVSRKNGGHFVQMMYGAG